MPLSIEAPNLIRANLETVARGKKAPLIVIGHLTQAQLETINQNREVEGLPAITGEVVFHGGHVFKSRILRDGYSIDDVVDQIASAMSCESLVLDRPPSTVIRNPNPRADNYGAQVNDEAVFECTQRRPRPELYSVIPKGDVKPKLRAALEDGPGYSGAARPGSYSNPAHQSLKQSIRLYDLSVKVVKDRR